MMLVEMLNYRYQEHTSVIRLAMDHCHNLLNNSRCGKLPYHNIQHTFEVYQYVQRIADYENLTPEEKEIVVLASLFHDTGNSNTYKGHEKISADNAYAFLSNIGYPEENIEKVCSCIKATQMPQAPKTKIEEILCDADLAHLGTNAFRSKNKLLRSEWFKCFNKNYTDKEWLENNICFLESHSYFTSYGKEILLPKKQKNLQLLKQAYNRLLAKK